MKLRYEWEGKTYTLDSGLFQSQSVDWATPQALYADLDAEFHFNDDPCHLRAMTDGLSREWGRVGHMSTRPMAVRLYAGFVKPMRKAYWERLLSCCCRRGPIRSGGTSMFLKQVRSDSSGGG